MTPVEFTAFARAERVKWAEVAKAVASRSIDNSPDPVPTELLTYHGHDRNGRRRLGQRGDCDAGCDNDINFALDELGCNLGACLGLSRKSISIVFDNERVLTDRTG